ncbi:hypothetical protein LNTAR_08989 [Lentisphaera araneosa HTCC2155]|uniref:DUF1501 domain-containing protein n=1 Tax=Lentisphaera araneosa HTCC2155 TaxID=313628 RepID=A6DI39_9BACT|nr:DUF1501 domain-containing protein [Lentisphaera araneosa]EDM28693.1 hypothetical protein LNTAR_08989 [Lentisphaera araneosa HTCC2155]
MDFNRRNFIKSLSAGALAPSLMASSGRRIKAQAKQVLVIFEQGGVSQIDTFDPKPMANIIHRSPFKTIKTKVPGIHFTELMNRTAKVADRLTVVRSMYQKKASIGNSHPLGSQYIMSAGDPTGPVELPDIGSVIAHHKGRLAPYLPAYVHESTGEQSVFASRLGFLEAKDKAFAIKYGEVNGLGLSKEAIEQLLERRKLLSKLNSGLGKSTSDQILAMQTFSQQAEEMLINPNTVAAFDLSSEPDHIKKMYGPEQKELRQRADLYMLGRKLIESGVRYVCIDTKFRNIDNRYPGGGNMNWDHHDAIYSKTHTNIPGGGAGGGRYGIGTWPMMGSTDWAFSGLIEDMDQRGLLEDTLVCFVTELGRTPKINERQGRDHWTHAFSYAFAGAGVPRGHVVGETDKDGYYITSSRGYTIEDFGATVLEKMGIDNEAPIHTPGGRPMFIAKGGHAIPELFA